MKKKISACATILLAVAMIAACGGAYNAEKAYWQFNRKFKNVLGNPATASAADFQAAEDGLRNIIHRFPSWERCAELQFMRAQMYLLRGDLTAADTELLQLAMSYPDNSALCARSQFMRGALREQQGELASAIKLFREISEKYPLSPTGLQTPLYIASCYQKHGMNDEVLRAYDQAAANYRNLIEMNPYSKTVPVLQELLALAYVRRGTPRQAIDALIGFAGKFPKSEASPYALAIAAQVYHEKLNDAPEAIKLYNQVVKSYPATALAKESRLKIGNLYVHMRDFPKAQAEYTAVLRQYPNDPLIGAMSHKALGLAYDFEGKWGLAQKEFDALLQQYPNSREALQVPFLIAAHYNRANRPAEADAALESAVRQYKDVITRNPGKPVAVEAQEMIANSCLLRKKEGEAIEALALLRATYPRDPRAASALFKIASIYENGARDAAKAADMYQQFLATYPDHELSFTAKTRLDKIRSEKRECQKI